jgi:hypothetical protein
MSSSVETDEFGGFGEEEDTGAHQSRQPTYHRAQGDAGNPAAQRNPPLSQSTKPPSAPMRRQDSFRGFGESVPAPPTPAKDEFAGFSEEDEDEAAPLPPKPVAKPIARRHAPSFKGQPQNFQCPVTVPESQFAAKLKLQGECTFTISVANKVYITQTTTHETSTWPVQLLRRYVAIHRFV